MPKKTAAAAPAPEKAPAEKKKAEKGKEKGKASASPAAPAPAKKEAKAKKKWSKYTIFNSAQSHFRRQTLSWVYIMQIGLMLVNKGSWRKYISTTSYFKGVKRFQMGRVCLFQFLLSVLAKNKGPRVIRNCDTILKTENYPAWQLAATNTNHDIF